MVGYGGVQVDCGFFTWRCREDGRSHGYEPGSQEEESEFGWGHAGILGLSRGIFGGDTQGTTGNPRLELKRAVDSIKMQ